MKLMIHILMLSLILSTGRLVAADDKKTASIDAITLRTPKYSELKKLSDSEIERRLQEFTGLSDNWKKNPLLVANIKKYLPFHKRTRAQDRQQIISLHASDAPRSLQQMVLVSQSSSQNDMRGIVTLIKSDKALVKRAYMFTSHYDLASLLLFFINLEKGDTGLEVKKFTEYPFAFKLLATDINLAFERAKNLNLPFVLEFESASLNTAKSPITRLIYDTITNDPSRVLKMEVTPDGGKLVSLHPDFAPVIGNGLDAFVSQFSTLIKAFVRGPIFNDKEAKDTIIEFLRHGKGLNSILYSEEKLQNMLIQKYTCRRLFGD